MKKINTLVVFLLCFLLVHAQEASKITQSPWTLEGCIDYALKNNIQIKQSELGTELSQSNLLQSKGNLLPSINANASHTYNYGRRIDPFTNSFATTQVVSENIFASADFSLFNGLQNINTIQQNKYNYLASKSDVDKMKNDVALNIATAYLQILYNMDAADNARNQMGIANAQVERTKKLVDAGVTAKGTLLDIQSQLALEELNLTNAQNQLDISYLSLVQLLNLSSVDGFSIVKPNLEIANESLLAVSPSQIYTTAIGTLPEIKSAEYKVKAADKGIDAAWGGLSPRLSFSASYGTGYSGASVNAMNEKIPFSEQYRNNVNQSFGFSLSIPIFNRFQTKTFIDKSRIQKLNSDLTVELTKLQVQKNIQQAYADANAGLKKYNASIKAVDAMQESFKYTEQKFNVGMVNTNDYNDAKNKLIKAQSDLLQAKYEYVFKTKVLDFYQGKPFKF